MREISNETMRELNADELEQVGGGFFGLRRLVRPPRFVRRGVRRVGRAVVSSADGAVRGFLGGLVGRRRRGGSSNGGGGGNNPALDGG